MLNQNESVENVYEAKQQSCDDLKSHVIQDLREMNDVTQMTVDNVKDKQLLYFTLLLLLLIHVVLQRKSAVRVRVTRSGLHWKTITWKGGNTGRHKE